MDYDTKLSSWFVVNFEDENNVIQEKILWGIVEYDNKQRFDKGSYVSTSTIVKKFNNEFFQTLNSIYKVEKDMGETINLPGTYFTHMLLKNGFSPLIITKLYNFQQVH